MKRTIATISGPVIFIGTSIAGASAAGDNMWQMAGIAVWMIIWWLSEAVPMSVTALLPIILFPAAGIMKIDQATTPYADPVIFLFMGGFIIAIALEKYRLHVRVALHLLKITGNTPKGIIGGFMAATGLLSMWISNTATTLMMLPMAISVIELVKPEAENKSYRNFIIALLLGIAYAANIGGTATIIGTPPNIVLAGILRKTIGYDISFSTWFAFGLPFSCIMGFITYYLLTRILFRSESFLSANTAERFMLEKDTLGKISKPEMRVLAVFVTTAALWVFRGPVNSLLPQAILNDTNIALAGAACLFLIPGTHEQRLLVWQDVQKLPWGILLLFGGGMSLAKGLEASGIIAEIGDAASPVAGNLLLLSAVLILIMLFLTEIMSNVALATVLIPVVIAISSNAGVHALVLAVPVTLASSCAFMMPIATPPNAIVFSGGFITSRDMAKAGLILNLVAVVLLVLSGGFIFPLIFR